MWFVTFNYECVLPTNKLTQFDKLTCTCGGSGLGFQCRRSENETFGFCSTSTSLTSANGERLANHRGAWLSEGGARDGVCSFWIFSNKPRPLLEVDSEIHFLHLEMTTVDDNNTSLHAD